MNVIYNEIDSFAAQWLRRLCAAGHIQAGDVIERDIANVKGTEVTSAPQIAATFIKGAMSAIYDDSV